MGIKGIYGELGPGERVAFSKLAVQHFERIGRPLRIAIDISIWQFQIQSGKGGSNPALRTLYYRLLRLLALNVQPLFVFDGPNKPPFKRNVRTQAHTASLPNFLAKQLLKLFGFPYHTAPGEAEAECALFQQEGLVDAVLSEDVDTLMFGCSLSLRNWSSEGTRGKKSPTHVSIYDAEKLRKSKAGLDREGMVLVALMSGGDYIPAGIPGCGIKTACQAAKAGFGHGLCKLSRNDILGVKQWREKLEHELRTNESGYFRVKHKSLKIPESFPDKAVLGYYIVPVVSPLEKLPSLRQSLNWDQEVDAAGLRGFVAEAFEWQNLSGAKKFMRGLAPALLAHKLRVRGENGSSSTDNSIDTITGQEAQLVQVICGHRTHFNTDGMPELRVAYLPTSIVGLDLELEETDSVFERDAELSRGHVSDSSDEPRSRSASPIKTRAPSQYDPAQPDKIWVLESFVKIGIPLAVETWEEEMRNPNKFATRKARARQTLAKGGMKKGALIPFVQTSKPGLDRTMRTVPCDIADMDVLPVFLAPATGRVSKGPNKSATRRAQHSIDSSRVAQKTPAPFGTRAVKPSPIKSTDRSSTNSVKADRDVTPWSLSRRPSDTFEVTLPNGTRYSALGIFGSPEDAHSANKGNEESGSCSCRSGYSSRCLSPSERRKHSRSPSPPSMGDNLEQSKTAHFKNVKELNSPNNVSIEFPSPSTLGSNGGSPHKKRFPTILQAQTSELIRLQTPTTLRRTLLSTGLSDIPDSDNHYALKPLSSQRVNRKIDFTSPIKPLDSSPTTTSPSSLPSPSVLFSPPPQSTARTDTDKTASFPPPLFDPDVPSPTPSRRSTAHARPKRMVALRESLGGTWKYVDDHEARTRKIVYQGVDVLDLSNSPRER